MREELYAHTPPNPNGPWHGLREHLDQVAKRAESFGEKFGCGEMARTLGRTHDSGKVDPRFQSYLRACANGRAHEKVPHADASASATWNLLKGFGIATMGHHSGLPDPDDAKRRLEAADPEMSTRAYNFALSLGEFEDPLRPPLWIKDRLTQEMAIRMTFSALVDADFLDTEKHFVGGVAPARGAYPPLAWYRDALRTYMNGKLKEAAAAPSRVNEVRREILECCRRASSAPGAAFRLTVPTGGGKTLSGLTFALDRAALLGLDRVIFAIPYTSIIDQTASVYAGVFGEHNLLEHHSGYEGGDGQEGQGEREVRRRLAAENWDCPLVVTTTVQLFESLFANRPSKCRKLHNISRSVIVLDEVQTLPVELLLPILDVLDQLVRHYGCSVVFCTATQPDFGGLGSNVLTNAAEIVDEPARYFQELERVEFELIETALSDSEVADRLLSHPQVLCVLNSRPDAVRVLEACRAREGSDLFHLSTLMCPDHRKAVLASVRSRLMAGDPVRLVSTQVVEAGVDLDFPVVMRDVGPLDRIIQVAGRCNREGKADRGRCVVFALASGRHPRAAYKVGIELTKTILLESGAAQLDRPHRVARYFQELYRYAGAESAKGKGARIQALRSRMHYKTVADEFQLIDQATIAVVALGYARDKVQAILDRAARESPRHLRRLLSAFSVAVTAWQFEQMQNEGRIRLAEPELWIYDGPYDPLLGIGGGSEPDPIDLIA